MTRPPYGETGAPFVLKSARALLENTEHEPLDQMNSDSLWIELRLACDEVDRLRAGLREALNLGWPFEGGASGASVRAVELEKLLEDQ